MLERLVGLRYDGVMCTRIEDGSCHALTLVTDPETGSTFSLEPGETVLEGLERFISRWERAEARSRSDFGRQTSDVGGGTHDA